MSYEFMINYSNSTIFTFVALLFLHISLLSQDTYPRNESVDVKKYIFNLRLNDTTNVIEAKAEIHVDFENEAVPFSLDLVGYSDTYGMKISSISEAGKPIDFVFENNKIGISPTQKTATSQVYTVSYHGIPERGLVIDTTKFGQRSFFGDNWPNLARHWLPSVDHPYDKSSIEFRIIAPDHYDVVATGKKIEESYLDNGTKLTVYREPAPVAMKVVTIGVTRFASRLLGEVYEVPVSAWVYPENRLEGFSDYGVATKVLRYFIDQIGPYSYAKLANMQAKTQWGGLENAGTIAYFENSVNGKNEVEGLIAHEIAHQWFGNSASEKDWNHVWLSEGFATYFAILYQESVYGDEKRKEELLLDRKQIIDYYKKNPSPIVDPSIKDPMNVLSVNTYQKGGWVLNMLHHELGDDLFWEGIVAYYKKYQNSNALTVDFKRVMEHVSGKDLSDFFQQWIFTKGYPEIKWSWHHEKNKLFVDVEQVQEHSAFSFPLEIQIGNDLEKSFTLNVIGKKTIFEIPLKEAPKSVTLDPNVWLLFEEIKEGK